MVKFIIKCFGQVPGTGIGKWVHDLYTRRQFELWRQVFIKIQDCIRLRYFSGGSIHYSLFGILAAPNYI
jgi:hypothetical protein